jgi:hypothetical protein
MTLSLLRVTWVLPFALGCAHAVYDEPSDPGSTGDTVTNTTGAASATGNGGSTTTTSPTAYAPGSGFAWTDAWTLVGPC